MTAAQHRKRGFTLIEVMITVVIVGVLAMLAYPSYVDYVRRGKRAVAQSALMDLASREQTYVLDRRTYTDATGTIGFVVPSEIANDYTFTFPTGCARCYDAVARPLFFTVQATPSTALAAKGELTLTLDDTGVKTPANTRGYWGK
jgi:type IV pilus assembly protein PilE